MEEQVEDQLREEVAAVEEQVEDQLREEVAAVEEQVEDQRMLPQNETWQF